MRIIIRHKPEKKKEEGRRRTRSEITTTTFGSRGRKMTKDPEILHRWLNLTWLPVGRDVRGFSFGRACVTCLRVSGLRVESTKPVFFLFCSFFSFCVEKRKRESVSWKEKERRYMCVWRRKKNWRGRLEMKTYLEWWKRGLEWWKRNNWCSTHRQFRDPIPTTFSPFC